MKIAFVIKNMILRKDDFMNNDDLHKMKQKYRKLTELTID